MTAQEFIISKLNKIADPINVTEIKDNSLEAAILSRVHSKKFRKLRVDQLAVDVARKSINKSIEANLPIQLRLDFGGNKLWRLEEAPYIDWGELFSLLYYVEWAKYIAQVYQPGVLLSYFSMDVCVERLNGIPHQETDKYSEDMVNLFDWIKPYIPKGVQLEYVRYGDLYENRDEYYAELEISKEKVMNDNDGRLPELSEKQKAATELNVMLQPGQDKDPFWREKVEVEHESIFGTKTGAAYLNDPRWIVHCPTWYSGYIATGSTKSSYAKFWAGVGALQKTDNSFRELVLTPKQLSTAKYSWENIAIEGLVGKNFSRIRVISQ